MREHQGKQQKDWVKKTTKRLGEKDNKCFVSWCF